jgi:hypothetical protein
VIRTMLGAIVVAVALVACPPQPHYVEPIAVPDAGEAEETADADAAGWSPCARACAHLRTKAIQCRTGYSVDGGDSCTSTCQHVVETKLAPLDVECAAKAASLDEAKRCKGWGC